MFSLIILSLFLLLVFLICRSINKILGLPPGPTPWPIVGNVFSIPFEGIDSQCLSLKREFGPVFTLWLPQPTIIITEYEALRRTIVKNGEAYAGRPNNFYLMKLIVQGNYGLIFEENAWYKSQRRFTIHTLRNLGIGSSSTKDTISSLSNRLVAQLRETKGEPIDIKDYLTNTAGNVIHQLAFGWIREHDDKEIVKFQRSLMDVFEHFTEPKMMLLDILPFLRHFDELLGIGLKSTLKANDEIVEFLRKNVEIHKESVDYDQEPTNYIDAYLHEIKRKKDEGVEDEFTEHQLTIAIYDLYSAGFETIVITLRFCLLYLLNYPHVQKEIHREIDKVIGYERSVSMDDQRVLPYTNAFLQEIYRLGYVLVVNLLRTTTEETDCEGFHLRPGTRVIPQFPSVHMDPDNFPNPSLLLPERHLKDGQFVKDDRITPFSIGKRACLGENLARMEVFMVFCSLMQHFSFLPSSLVPPPILSISSAFRAPALFQLRAIERHNTKEETQT